MHLSRRIKIQLAIFLAIALTAITVLTIGYAHAPALLFGVGRYEVRLQLTESAGLYERANVTYRGTQVGRVDSVELSNDGVTAVLSLNKDVEIPSDLTAEVHSASAVGEQYVALVPRNATSSPLRNGDVIPVDRTTTPPDINNVLNQTNTALEAIPRDNLKTLIDESYVAFGGLGPELSRVVDGAANLAIDGRKNLAELTNVIDNSRPLLDSQTDTSDSVAGWAAHLATITSQLQEQDKHVSGVLQQAGPAAEQARALLDRVNPTLPLLLSNLVSFNDVAIVYQPNLEQLLVLIPQNLAQLTATTVANLNAKSGVGGGNQEFATNLNLPPPCTTGYLPVSQWRSPVLEDYPPRPPGDFYCRIPQDANNVVRGARNIPCEGKPWKRAPTVALCESDQEYVPLNEGNFWKGDPNQTLTGQGVPQFIDHKPASSLGLPPGVTPSPDGRPPVSTPPAALGFADYNPANGTYVGPDGQVYTQSNLARSAKPPTLRSILAPESPG